MLFEEIKKNTNKCSNNTYKLLEKISFVISNKGYLSGKKEKKIFFFNKNLKYYIWHYKRVLELK